VLFLIEHLFTNSQAALWLGDNGKGFVRMVNALHNLPYLPVIEIVLLGVPILIHIVLGIKYLFTSKSNVFKGDGSKPYIPRARNYAYTLQRITSWILLIGVILHVYKFRFVDYPDAVTVHSETYYVIPVEVDPCLNNVADRLHVKLLEREEAAWIKKSKLKEHQVLAVAPDFGTATLFAVRDTFKHPIYLVLYTIFVLAACFHAFNGFWTFLISWGWILKMSAQRAWASVSVALMLLLTSLGLAAIWGSYWCRF
jgi:succinate dehydrogenase / fumarate reductase cytochrome b subunit